MNETNQARGFNRRDIVRGGAMLVVLAADARVGLAQPSVPAIASPVPPAQVTWQDAMRAMIGPAQPVEGRIAFELADTAENGNVVPFTLTVDSPMTEQDFVKVVHVFSTGNPKPDVASAYFTSLSGKAVFSSRMRLGRTQEVIAVAEMSDGRVFLGRRTVKVTIGGCGTG